MIAERLISPTITVAHGFFTRRGGVSEGPFASLNCSLSGADDRDAVMENRARVARAIGARPERLMGATQVHGAAVAVVTEPWAHGEGPRADALVSARPGLALGIVTADCAPVLFHDRARGVIGAAHAGWRGAAGGVLEATLVAMRELGAVDIVASVGPCIGAASYEVAADMRDAVLAQDPAGVRWFETGARAGHWRFDLAGFCVARLRAAGAEADQVAADTLADADRFFSHRRRTLAGGGPIGHQISAIVL